MLLAAGGATTAAGGGAAATGGRLGGRLMAGVGAGPRVRGAVTWVGGGTAVDTPVTGGPNLLARLGSFFFSQGILPTVGVGVFLEGRCSKKWKITF